MLILPVGKPHPGWFYIYGFNFAIVAGLFVVFCGWLLGCWRGIPASLSIWVGVSNSTPALILEQGIEPTQERFPAGPTWSGPSNAIFNFGSPNMPPRSDRSGWR